MGFRAPPETDHALRGRSRQPAKTGEGRIELLGRGPGSSRRSKIGALTAGQPRPAALHRIRTGSGRSPLISRSAILIGTLASVASATIAASYLPSPQNEVSAASSNRFARSRPSTTRGAIVARVGLCADAAAQQNIGNGLAQSRAEIACRCAWPLVLATPIRTASARRGASFSTGPATAISSSLASLRKSLTGALLSGAT